MDEQIARNVLLVRAIETTDLDHQILSDDDRLYASRSANELAQWDASDSKAGLTPALFLEKRAEQVLKKIAERTPAFSKVIAPKNWSRGIGIGLPLLALLTGALVDRIADPHRVDLLSAPLLLILLWNLLVYVGMLLWLVLPAAKPRWMQGGLLGWLTPGKISAPRKAPQVLAAALVKFGEEWTVLSARLTKARLQRIVHLAAACFALGALISLYARGILSQYRAGWESTFLDAGQVHALLSILFAPASALLGLQGFTIADVTALQFTQPAPLLGGAMWVHLYAATLLLLVIVPRLILASIAGWQEKKLARHFPLDLGQPYFRKLTEKIGPAVPAVLRIFPYSFNIDEVRDNHLTVIAHMLLGEQARVMLRPPTAYGDMPQESQPEKADIALTVALFNLTATPEKENHGAFLDHLLHHTTRGIAVMIDESAYLDRIGAQPGGEVRIRERIALWRAFCETQGLPVTIVNLLNPQSRADDLERGLTTSNGAQ